MIIVNRDFIAILMATYNGAEFLGEQIDSLLAQTFQDWHLYVHDDGSTDSTKAVLERYADEHPDKITLLHYPAQGGACQNFLSLLERTEAPYYMFCDQDDVWLPEKVELSLTELKRQEQLYPGKGVVVYTDLQIVDEKLSVVYPSMWKHSGVYPQYLRTFGDFGGHTATVTGCSMLFNQKAKASCAYPSDKATMHDIWVCLCTLRRGGIVKGCDSPLVLYRQHEHNCLGSGGTDASEVNLRYRIVNFRKMYKSNQRYYAMLSSLGYGSVVKYLYNKIKYKIRIRMGR